MIEKKENRRSSARTKSKPQQKTLLDHFSNRSKANGNVSNVENPLPSASLSGDKGRGENHAPPATNQADTLVDVDERHWTIDEGETNGTEANQPPPQKLRSIFSRSGHPFANDTDSSALQSAEEIIEVLGSSGPSSSTAVSSSHDVVTVTSSSEDDVAETSEEASTVLQTSPRTSGPRRSRAGRPSRSLGGARVDTTNTRQPSDGGTRNAPIILEDSSPLKPSAERKPVGADAKAIFPIFAKAQKIIVPSPSHSPQKSPSRRAAKQPGPSWPSAHSQHVRGGQTSFSSRPLILPRRGGQPETAGGPEAPADSDWSPKPTPSREDLDLYKNTVDVSHVENYPAIRRLYDLQPAHASQPSHQLWTDKWHPTAADQVLGNERSALTLRDWLRNLALQLYSAPLPPQATSKRRSTSHAKNKDTGTKRPRVLRAVDKTRRKRRRVDSDEEDDWIVDDDESTVELSSQTTGHEDEDELDFIRETQARLQRAGIRPDDPPMELPSQEGSPMAEKPSIEGSLAHFDQLTNTILLAGPPGCGKTAAVYACAAELGYEVFEVYPGVGRRGGSNLNDMIGEVGKSHLVAAAKQDSKSSRSAFRDLFAGKAKGSAKEPTSGDVGRSTNVDSEQNHAEMTGPKVDSPSASSGIRQSIILLEEVDILYKEDTGFWPSIIDLIKECKRPVVMTCNDISLVPLQDLPIQSVLAFDPCPTAVMKSYLQCLCLAEGCVADPQFLERLCETPHELHDVDLQDYPLHPSTRNLSVPDLRRAIHQLQLQSVRPAKDLTAPISGSESDSVDRVALEDLADWGTTSFREDGQVADNNASARRIRSLSRHVDAVSFLDSNLLRRSMEAPQALASLHSYEPSTDDEIGHPILFGANVDEEWMAPKGPLPGTLFHEPRAQKDHFTLGLKTDALVFHNWDALIAEEAMRLARAALEGKDKPTATISIPPASEALRARALFRARVGFQSQVVGVLDEVMPPLAPLMPRPAVFMDYEAWIRHMVATDDELEATESRTSSEVPDRKIGRKPRRLTRNSQRIQYVRQITLSEEQRRTLADTRLSGL